MKADNDNQPVIALSAISGTPLNLHRNRSQSLARLAEENLATKKQKRRIAKRQSIGKDWDGKADNDNIAWPLAKALLAEGNGDLLKYAMRYRQIYTAAKSEAVLGGASAPLGKGMSLDQRVHIRTNGTIAYKGARQVEAGVSDEAPKMKVIPYANEEDNIERNVVRIPKPWSGDRPVNDMIDAQGLLSSIQRHLGHLCEPFEMACIDGRTLAEVGNAAGIANRAGSMGAGRAIVHMALFTVRDALGEVRRHDLAA